MDGPPDAAPEYAETARALVACLEPRIAPLLAGLHPVGAVIGVAGEARSGKTTTAVALARALEGRGVATAVLHQDDYYHRPPRANHEHRREDLARVGPHEVNLALLQEHVAAFRARRAVEAPVVDSPSDAFLSRTLDLAAAHALVVEGAYALLLDDLDARIFLAATHEDTRARRDAGDADGPFLDEVRRIEHALIAPQAERADVVVDRDFLVHPRLTQG